MTRAYEPRRPPTAVRSLTPLTQAPILRLQTALAGLLSLGSRRELLWDIQVPAIPRSCRKISIVPSCTSLYNQGMKVTVTEARQRLPELVRRVKGDADFRVQITVHGDVAAELRASPKAAPAGAAARRLKEVMAQLPEHSGKKRRVSERVNEHLYGKAPE